MSETRAEEIARLKREISAKQERLQFLVLGDPSQGVSVGQTENMARLFTPIYGHLT